MVDEKKVLANILGDSILDCGCGIGRWGSLIKSLVPSKKVAGVEIDRKYLSQLRKKKSYDFLIQADVAYLPFKPESFDTVLAIEVIEHQTRKPAMSFLNYVDEVARWRVILTTPHGFLHTTENEEHRFEDHKSGWEPSDLEQNGYAVDEFEWHGLRWLFAMKLAKASQATLLPSARSSSTPLIQTQQGKHDQ